MENEKAEIRLSVSQFVDIVNQTFELAMPAVVVQGEVSSYSVRQGKWVRFKLKDDNSSIDCFGSVFQIRQPLEDGMVVAVVGRPRLSDRYGFSFSVQTVQPVGEGSIKRSFELLQKKLEAEGLFDSERKRPLPEIPRSIGLISSTQAAGYVDFLKILEERWGGMKITVAPTLVQGVHAPGQITRAIEYFNKLGDAPEVLVIVRGGGDADDLAAFNDEGLVRAIAASRIPTLVGVGHEIDITLADLACDKRAATPSNAAQLLVPDKREIIGLAAQLVASSGSNYLRSVNDLSQLTLDQIEVAYEFMIEKINGYQEEAAGTYRLLKQYDPETVLSRGYALIRGEVKVGSVVTIERSDDNIEAEVQRVSKK